MGMNQFPLEEQVMERDKATPLVISDADATAGVYLLSARDTKVYASTVSGAFAIKLPSVALAKGKIYTIYMTLRTSTYDITVTELGDSIDWSGHGDYTLNLATDRVAYYSDGEVWWQIAAGN